MPIPFRCPKCDVELEVTEGDPEVGIVSAGAYCGDCDEAYDVPDEDYDYDE